MVRWNDALIFNTSLPFSELVIFPPEWGSFFFFSSSWLGIKIFHHFEGRSLEVTATHMLLVVE